MERRILIPTRIANKNITELEEEEAQAEYTNEDSEYFSYRLTSYDIDDLKMARLAEGETEDITLLLEPTGEIVFLKISLIELHNKLNKLQIQTWN